MASFLRLKTSIGRRRQQKNSINHEHKQRENVKIQIKFIVQTSFVSGNSCCFNSILMQNSRSVSGRRFWGRHILSLAVSVFEVVSAALQPERETQHETNHILQPQKWLLNACNMLLMPLYCLFLNLLSITKMQFFPIEGDEDGSTSCQQLGHIGMFRFAPHFVSVSDSSIRRKPTAWQGKERSRLKDWEKIITDEANEDKIVIALLLKSIYIQIAAILFRDHESTTFFRCFVSILNTESKKKLSDEARERFVSLVGLRILIICKYSQ